ncbi:hypothetical protein ccbrp13_15150 [Ktedonobacteria bacterium brp13]|nr:hypothetical protein ccbrp13_15150 [Ktedonobacteria bacterium brp13]
MAPAISETFSYLWLTHAQTSVSFLRTDDQAIGMYASSNETESSDKSEHGEPLCPTIYPNFSWVHL